MENLLIRETFVNRTENCIFEEGEITKTSTNNLGLLFKKLQSKYGRATKMFAENGKQTGWIFTKIMTYENSESKYKREVWVTVYASPNEVYNFEKNKNQKSSTSA